MTVLANSTEKVCAECRGLTTRVLFNPMKLGVLTS